MKRINIHVNIIMDDKAGVTKCLDLQGIFTIMNRVETDGQTLGASLNLQNKK
jgi:hypothetical protein